MQIKNSFTLFELILVLILSMIFYGLLFDSSLFKLKPIKTSFDIEQLTTMMGDNEAKSKIKFICIDKPDCELFNEISIIKKAYLYDIYFEYENKFYQLNSLSNSLVVYNSQNEFEATQESLKKEAINSVF